MKNTNNKLDITMKKEALQHQLKTLEVYEQLRKKLEDEINWNYMKCNEPDEEHDSYWFTMPDEDSYRYEDCNIALDILSKLDDLIVK